VSNSASPQLAKTLGFVSVGGLLGFIAILKILLDNGRLDPAAIVIILFAYLTTLFLICGMMVGHLWKHSGDIRVHPNESDEYVPPKSFRGSITARLEGHREPAVSVTEHTTRTLDEMPIERR
jgi:hypothetical protein